MNFYSIILKFYEKATFFICDDGNGGVKNKILNDGSILTGKKYDVHIK